MLFARMLFSILLLLPSSWGLIGERNKAIEQAERYYAETEFEDAVRQHLLLISDYQLNTEEVRFNLALSYQNNGQEADAEKTYAAIIPSSHQPLSSFSANQVGVLQGREEKYQEALASFKTALLKNPQNEYARYNYELLSRWLENRDENKDEDKSDKEDQMQPSNYAKRMKAEADALVDQFQFNQALDVMNKALEIDETVSYYEEFIKNLSEIKEIDEN